MPQSVCISFPAFSSGNFSRAYTKSSLNLWWSTAKIWHPAWWKAEDWMLMIKHRVTWHHVSPQNKKTPKAYQHLGSFPLPTKEHWNGHTNCVCSTICKPYRSWVRLLVKLKWTSQQASRTARMVTARSCRFTTILRFCPHQGCNSCIVTGLPIWVAHRRDSQHS